VIFGQPLANIRSQQERLLAITRQKVSTGSGYSAVVGPDETHANRKRAGERLLAAWGVAIVPNTLEAFGVELPDEWWWYVIRYGLSAIWCLALVSWLAWVWRERNARRVDRASA
jgi:hypothetical protein